MEKRAHPRYPVRYLAHCWRGEQRTTGITVNLSEGGCAVQTYIPLPEQAYLELQLFLPGHRDPLEIGSAAVRWAIQNTAGLEFLHVAPKEYERLLALVESLARLPPS